MRSLLLVIGAVLAVCLPILAISAAMASIALLQMSGVLGDVAMPVPGAELAAYPASAPTNPGFPTAQPAGPSFPTAQPAGVSFPTAQPTSVSLPTAQPTSVLLPTAQPVFSLPTRIVGLPTRLPVALPPTQVSYSAWTCGCLPYPPP